MKITIENENKDYPLSVTISDNSWETNIQDTIDLAIRAIEAQGFSKKIIVEALQEYQEE